MLHTFLKYRDHYTSNIIVAAHMQHCNMQDIATQGIYNMYPYLCICMYNYTFVPTQHSICKASAVDSGLSITHPTCTYMTVHAYTVYMNAGFNSCLSMHTSVTSKDLESLPTAGWFLNILFSELSPYYDHRKYMCVTTSWHVHTCNKLRNAYRV